MRTNEITAITVTSLIVITSKNHKINYFMTGAVIIKKPVH